MLLYETFQLILNLYALSLNTASTKEVFIVWKQLGWRDRTGKKHHTIVWKTEETKLCTCQLHLSVSGSQRHPTHCWRRQPYWRLWNVKSIMDPQFNILTKTAPSLALKAVLNNLSESVTSRQYDAFSTSLKTEQRSKKTTSWHFNNYTWWFLYNLNMNVSLKQRIECDGLKPRQKHKKSIGDLNLGQG